MVSVGEIVTAADGCTRLTCPQVPFTARFIFHLFLSPSRSSSFPPPTCRDGRHVPPQRPNVFTTEWKLKSARLSRILTDALSTLVKYFRLSHVFYIYKTCFALNLRFLKLSAFVIKCFLLRVNRMCFSLDIDFLPGYECLHMIILYNHVYVYTTIRACKDGVASPIPLCGTESS